MGVFKFPSSTAGIIPMSPDERRTILPLNIAFMKKQALSALVLVGLGMATSPVFADSETQSAVTDRPAHRIGTGSVNESAKR